MQNLGSITIDGKTITPESAYTYQELLKIELLNNQIEDAFPFKPETPRYHVSSNDTPMGYYKVLSVKALANNETSMLSLHRQA